MNIIIWLIVTFLIMLAGVWFAPHAPGYMLIRIGVFAVETSVVAFVVILTSTMMLVWFAIKLWRMPGNTVRKFLKKRAEAQLELGILALSEGDWSKAEKALSRSAKSGKTRSVSYIAAAQAAHSRGAEDRGEAYLDQADQPGRAHDSVVITRAQMALASGDPQTALTLLDEFKQTRSKKPRVLDLFARCYERLGRWRELAALAPELVKSGAISAERADALKNKALISAMTDAKDDSELKLAWKGLSRAEQKKHDYLLTYTDQALHLGYQDGLEKILRSSLNQDWSEQLCDRYSQLSDDSQLRLKHAESWLSQHADSEALQLLLAQLCVERELWGKAEQHIDRCLELGSNPLAYELKAKLALNQDDTEKAVQFYQQAIKLLK